VISAFGVEHGAIFKASQKKDRKTALQVGGAVTGAEVARGSHRGVRAVNQVIGDFERGGLTTRAPGVKPTPRVLPGSSKAGLRFGGAIGGGAAHAPRAAAIGAAAGGGVYGVSRLAARKKKKS
jgi:hypothetical protein